MHDALLAVDIGTTNVKGAIFSPEGSPASASKRISLEIDSALGTAEQDPEEVAQAVFSVIKELA
ncbi:MAG: FGGY family carbohydrate kinase, partial [Thermofilum sp.]